MTTTLTGFFRGDTLKIDIELDNGYIFDDFSEVKLTVRTRKPSSSVTTDDDPTVLAQVVMTDGGIVATSDTEATATIPASTTTSWRASDTRPVYVDCQVTIDGSPDEVYTIVDALLFVTGDVTREP